MFTRGYAILRGKSNGERILGCTIFRHNHMGLMVRTCLALRNFKKMMIKHEKLRFNQQKWNISSDLVESNGI